VQAQRTIDPRRRAPEARWPEVLLDSAPRAGAVNPGDDLASAEPEIGEGRSGHQEGGNEHEVGERDEDAADRDRPGDAEGARRPTDPPGEALLDDGDADRARRRAEDRQVGPRLRWSRRGAGRIRA